MILIALQGTTMLLLAIVMLWRIRRARTNAPAGRWVDPAWGAAVFAILGLLTTLNFLPEWEWMDAVISGGSPDRNMWALAQTLFAISSFWFLRNALRNVVTLRSPSATGRQPIRTWIGFLFVPLSLVTLFFLLIRDRGPTDPAFVDKHLSDPALTTALTIYMLTLVALICDSMLTLLRGWRTVRLPYLGGMILVIGACAVDLAYCWVGASSGSTRVTDVMFIVFESLFYPGILLMTLGYCTLVVLRLDPRFIFPALRLGKLTAHYRRSLGDHGKFPSVFNESWITGTARGALEYCYSCLVEIHNLEVEHGLILGARDRDYVEFVESRLNARLELGHGHSIRPEGAPWSISTSMQTRPYLEDKDANVQSSAA